GRPRWPLGQWRGLHVLRIAARTDLPECLLSVALLRSEGSCPGGDSVRKSWAVQTQDPILPPGCIARPPRSRAITDSPVYSVRPCRSIRPGDWFYPDIATSFRRSGKM